MTYCTWITLGRKPGWSWAIWIEMLIHGQSGRLWMRCQISKAISCRNNCSECVCGKSLMPVAYCGWLARGANDFQKPPVSLGTCVDGLHGQKLQLFGKWSSRYILLNYASPSAMIHCILLSSRFIWGCRRNIYSVRITNQRLRGNLTPSGPPSLAGICSPLVSANWKHQL